MSTPTSPSVTATSTASATTTSGERADLVVMSLLHEHVPLALLCDLTLADGPSSAAILEAEGAPDSRWWERTPA